MERLIFNTEQGSVEDCHETFSQLCQQVLRCQRLTFCTGIETQS